MTYRRFKLYLFGLAIALLIGLLTTPSTLRQAQGAALGTGGVANAQAEIGATNLTASSNAWPSGEHAPAFKEFDSLNSRASKAALPSENVEVIGQIGGRIYAVAVDGDMAYLGVGPRLVIMDISDPANLQVLGQTDVLPGLVRDVVVADSYAYVAADSSGLRIIDVSTPAAPSEVGFVDTPGLAEDVAVAGSYAYVADGTSGLRIIDVSTPAAPSQVGFVDMRGYARGVAVAGSYAYVADGFSGLHIIDVSTPATPSEVGFYDSLHPANGVVVVGSYAYVAADSNGLRVIDVSTPAAPSQVGIHDTEGYASGVTVAGSYAYVADGSGGLRIIDVSTPAAPSEVGFVDTPGNARDVVVAGSYAYVADGSSGLRIIDVSTPAAPSQVGIHDTEGYASGVTVAGSYAYVADGSGGLRIIDVSTPAAPSQVGFVDTPGNAQGVTVSGNYAYVANYASGLRIIDVSTPAAPSEVGFYDTPSYAPDVVVAGRDAYVADGAGGLMVLRFTDPNGTISGTNFHDQNRNGVQDAGEWGIGGVIIEVTDANGNVLATTWTAGDGSYLFSGLPAGSYTVSQVAPPGFHPTTPTSVTVSVSDGGLATANFGNVQSGIISGVKFHDINGNGLQDVGEPGIGGVIIELTDASGNVLATTTTAGNGSYQFSELLAGAYTVSEVVPDGWQPTTPASVTVELGAGSSANVNFGNVPAMESVSISGPTSGDVNTTYTFTSIVNPDTATTPIAHVWRTTDQSPLTHLGGVTDTVSYTWDTPGVKEVRVIATNASGRVETTHQITILPPPPPPTDVTLWGPQTAGTNKPVWVSAQINPLTATVPMTYTWETDGQSPITFVRDETYGWDWSNDGGWDWNGAWASFTWDTVGPKVVTFTASNAGGTITATRTITLSLPPTVALTGPTTGEINTDIAFTANVSPTSVTTPINYSWRATDQSNVSNVDGLSDTVSFNWSTGGTKVIQVNVWNGVGWDEDALLFEIPIPLPPLTPTIQALGSGDWDNPATWGAGRVPTISDTVLIPANLSVTASEPIEVESLINHGTLQGSGEADLIINATQVLSNTGVIRGSDGTTSLTSTSWIKPNGIASPPKHRMLATNSHPACNETLLPTGSSIIISTTKTFNDGVIQAPDGVSGTPGSPNGGDGGNVTWTPSPNTAIYNDLSGTVCSGGGGDSFTGGSGGNGGNVTLTGSPVDNDGVIWAGDGGNGTHGGGKGGSTYVFGQNTTNFFGDIGAGNGGNTTANIVGAKGGDGGETEVWGKWVTGGGFLVNSGNITAGDGGNGNLGATNPQDAGCGGNLTLMAAPRVFLAGGTHAAGVAGTPSPGGATCTDGNVRIDPLSISLSGSTTRIEGNDIFIYSGDDGQLDLSNLSDEAISATGSITIAVGNGGVVDLTGNGSRILQAAEQVNIYADEIKLDPGVRLFALAGTNVVTDTSRILRGVSVVAPNSLTTPPDSVVPVKFIVLNSSPTTDTFTLSLTDSAGWSVSGLPSQITLGGLDNQELTFNVTVPFEAQSGSSNQITLQATSQADPNTSAEAELIVSVVPADEVNQISLVEGWNLISVPVQPTGTDISQVLGSIAGSYDLVYAYDACDTADQWKKYDPSAPPFANDLTDVDETMGLWINMTVTDTLSVSGTTPGTTDIPLCEGWNLTGNPSTQQLPVADALTSVSGAYDLIYAYEAADTADPWKKHDPNAPPFANDLTEMAPGWGYWIDANQDATWSVSNP